MTNDPRPLWTKAWVLAVGLLGVSLAGALASGVPVFNEVKRDVTVQVDGKNNTTNGTGGKGGAGTKGGGGTGGGGTVVALPPSKPGLECARGRNGGSTDKGVSGEEIKLAATVVRSGIAKAFLGDVPTAMQAVADKVNAGGGICGRILKLKLVDDGWDPQLGASTLRSLMAENPFAMPVVPSSEGLRIIIDADMKQRKLDVPIVGTDGMLIGQYLHPMVWPVAASTVSAMHVMVDQAWKRGFKTFGLVYEWTYHFGVEGAYAFNEAVKRKTGQSVPGYSHPSNPKCEGTFCAIQANQPSYSTQVNTFNENCQHANPQGPVNGGSPSCGLVALLLEPGTALTWIADGGAMPPGGRTMGPQPLFNTDFARACGKACNDLWVWSGYRPPLAPYDDLAPVRAYVGDVKRRQANIDTMNSFTIGGYVGMNLFVEAARQVGPELTRQRLAAVLDTMTYDSGIAPPLKWGQGNHFANGSLLAYKMRYSNQTFAGFQPASPFVRDPWLGMDTKQ